MMEIANQLAFLRSELPAGVRIVAVSKTQPAERIMEAYEAGQRIFGENKAQELQTKQILLPADIEWHFIGHLQSNKVSTITRFVGMIHGIDSLKLLRGINQEALKRDRNVSCLLQFHIATEESKFGLSLDEARHILSSPEFQHFHHVTIAGVMGMATFSDDHVLVRKEFRQLRSIFETLRSEYFSGIPEFCECSMGMTGDYKIAVEEGATLIRIGTLIFGERNY